MGKLPEDDVGKLVDDNINYQMTLEKPPKVPFEK